MPSLISSNSFNAAAMEGIVSAFQRSDNSLLSLLTSGFAAAGLADF
jgi:hypothetical protein